MQEELPPVIILDNGSGYLKTGLSCYDAPQITIPALIGRQLLRYGEKITFNPDEEGNIPEYKEIMIGDEVIPYKSLLDLSYPIEEGKIKNLDDLEKLWEYAINNKLKIDDTSDKKVLITEAPLNPIDNKIKMCQILFEKLGVAAANIEVQAKCSLFCEGLDTGIVLDSGDGVTHCIPIVDGTLFNHSMERLNLSGRDITKYLIRLLQKKGYNFNSSAHFELVREIKEKFCFVSNDIKGDRQLELNSSYFNSYYLLPDGRRLNLSSEKFEAPELLFNPELDGKDFEGIQDITFRAINSCPIDTRARLYGSMVLSGGSTLFPGFTSRLENEIKELYKKEKLKHAEEKKIKISINAIDSPRRKYSVFIGAAIIGKYYNTPESDDYWITNAEWLEKGESVADKEALIKDKCQSYFKENLKKKK